MQGFPVWQRNYHEHIIRNQQDYQNISNYIVNNPLNWENDAENINQS
jgi:putative transposase